MIQTQWRYLLTGGLPARLSARLQSSDASTVIDGFLELARINSGFTRVRIIRHDGKQPFALTSHKVGTGRRRRLEQFQLPVEDARRMIHWCPYRLSKRRYGLEGCTVDIFEEPLAGLVVVESQTPGLPDFLKDVGGVLDVTESLDGFRLAQLAYELRQLPSADPIGMVLGAVSRLPRLVLLGGPGSGKSTVLAAAQKHWPRSLHCIPEVATIVIGQLGLRPWTGGDQNLLACQQLIFRVQHGFEDAADFQARLDGRKVVICDRGSVGGAGYLPGGVPQFEAYLRTTVPVEYGRYDLVLYLDMPSRQVYNAIKANNPSRTETYKQACARAELELQVWQGHPHFIRIADAATWKEKKDAALVPIREFLRQASQK